MSRKQLVSTRLNYMRLGEAKLKKPHVFHCNGCWENFPSVALLTSHDSCKGPKTVKTCGKCCNFSTTSPNIVKHDCLQIPSVSKQTSLPLAQRTTVDPQRKKILRELRANRLISATTFQCGYCGNGYSSVRDLASHEGCKGQIKDKSSRVVAFFTCQVCFNFVSNTPKIGGHRCAPLRPDPSKSSVSYSSSNCQGNLVEKEVDARNLEDVSKTMNFSSMVVPYRLNKLLYDWWGRDAKQTDVCLPLPKSLTFRTAPVLEKANRLVRQSKERILKKTRAERLKNMETLEDKNYNDGTPCESRLYSETASTVDSQQLKLLTIGESPITGRSTVGDDHLLAEKVQVLNNINGQAALLRGCDQVVPSKKCGIEAAANVHFVVSSQDACLQNIDTHESEIDTPNTVAAEALLKIGSDIGGYQLETNVQELRDDESGTSEAENEIDDKPKRRRRAIEDIDLKKPCEICKNRGQFNLKAIYDHSHKCQKCEARFLKEHWLDNHMEMMHNQWRRKKNVVERVSKKLLLKVEKEKNTVEKWQVCHLCGAKVYYKRWSIHMEKRHADKGSRLCDICGKVLANYAKMLKHKRLTHSKGPIKCRICQEKFLRGEPYKTHLLEVHNIVRRVYRKPQQLGQEKQFSCKECDVKVPTRMQLKAHMRYHEEETNDVQVEMVDESENGYDRSTDQLKIEVGVPQEVERSVPALVKLTPVRELPENLKIVWVPKREERYGYCREYLCNTSSGPCLFPNEHLAQTSHGQYQYVDDQWRHRVVTSIAPGQITEAEALGQFMSR